MVAQLYWVLLLMPETKGVSLEAIQKRLEEYRRNTAPLIEYYQGSGRLVSVNGTQEPQSVFAALCQAVA